MTPTTSLITGNAQGPSLSRPGPLSPDPAVFDFSTLAVVTDRGSSAAEPSARRGKGAADRSLIIYRPVPELKPVSESTRIRLGRLRRSAPRLVPGLLFGAAALALLQSPVAIHGFEAALGTVRALTHAV